MNRLSISTTALSRTSSASSHFRRSLGHPSQGAVSLSLSNGTTTNSSNTLMVGSGRNYIAIPFFSSPTFPHATQQQQQQQQQQYRSFVDFRKKKKKLKRVNDPFRVLNVTEGMTYKDVKKAFLKIAMTNHPDTAKAVSDEERDTMRDTFVAARIAFEGITEDFNGIAIRKEDEEEDPMENFDSWFKSETGFDTPFQLDMDPETMKEVASMTEQLGEGLDRDGGMWALARMVTSTVKAGGDAATMLRLDSGDTTKSGPNPQINGVLRRRRRR